MQQAEMPRRKWAFPLSVVAPVMIDIDQVIQQVGARRPSLNAIAASTACVTLCWLPY
jgi:hypothetical protein